MEALWILLGGLISMVSVVVAWRLNSLTSRDTQGRQHNHELAMERQRLEAERQNRQDEAIRAARRAGLEPVFDLMSRVEGGYSYRFWKSIIEHAERDRVFDAALAEHAADLFPDGISADLRERVVRRIIDVVPQPSPDILAHAATVISRISDENLRRDAFSLAAGLFLPIPDFRACFVKIAEIHRRLELYAATVDSASPAG